MTMNKLKSDPSAIKIKESPIIKVLEAPITSQRMEELSNKIKENKMLQTLKN